jgi:hypothetical protein
MGKIKTIAFYLIVFVIGLLIAILIKMPPAFWVDVRRFFGWG